MQFGIPIEIKEFRSDDEDWRVEGYAAAFENKDEGDDVLHRGAFEDSLKTKRHVAFLHSHDPRMVLGKPQEIVEERKGLFSRNLISKTQLGRDTRELIMDGAMGGFSIGFQVPRDGAEISKDGKIRHLKRVDLYEISLVALPMNDQAVVTGVKNFWPALTLVEKIQSLTGALSEILGDTEGIVEGPGDLNETKQKELVELLEMFSGFDDARHRIDKILTAASMPRVGLTQAKQLQIELEQARKDWANILQEK